MGRFYLIDKRPKIEPSHLFFILQAMLGSSNTAAKGGKAISQDRDMGNGRFLIRHITVAEKLMVSVVVKK